MSGGTLVFVAVLGVLLVGYVGFVVMLFVLGRREDARAVAGFIPDCVVLLRRLLRDERVSRRHKLLLAALVPYLLLPFDLVPDFIPVAGQLDDVILVAFVLRRLVRSAEPGLIEEHWPGPPASLTVLLRLTASARR